jgi:hypothetical protein
MLRNTTRYALVCATLAAWSCSSGSGPGTASQDAAAEIVGYPPSGDDGSEGCVLDGYPCGDGGPCCSGVCSDGVCGAEGTCTPVGGPCESAGTCCSRVCTDAGCVDGG